MRFFSSCRQEKDNLRKEINELRRDVRDLKRAASRNSAAVNALVNSSLFKIAISVEKAVDSLVEQKLNGADAPRGIYIESKPSVLSYGSGL